MVKPLPPSLMDHSFSNSTIYGTHNATVRFTWTGWYIFVMLSSMIGDSTILIGSLRYRALRLHGFIVVIIQHIAVCDILVSVFNVMPMMTALMFDQWILGEVWCALTPYPVYISNSASIMLICAMTMSRLFLLKVPSRQRWLTERKAHLMCFTIWFLSMILPAMFLIIGKDDVWFDQRIYLCDYTFSHRVWKWLLPLMTSFVIYMPTVLTGLSTVPLIVYMCHARKVAKRSGGSRRWQGIMTAVLTACIYSVSVLPYAVYRFVQSSFDPLSFFHIDYFRLSVSFLYLNTISNFYIYCLTVPSFRNFLRARLAMVTGGRRPSYFIAPTTSNTQNGNGKRLRNQRGIHLYLVIIIFDT